ncbi:MAG: helix-turn-helix domain-containing protein [Candidatus Nanopelagicales bacterium]
MSDRTTDLAASPDAPTVVTDPVVTDVPTSTSRSPRSRAGNAMGRTRAAALDGARRVLTEHGVRKATMGDIAVRGGLAKATLYNHFRTKDEVIAALVADDLAELADDCRDLARDDLAVALTRAADAVAGHTVLAGLRTVEPTALLAVVVPGEGVSWDAVRARTAEVLDTADRASGPEHVDLVLRWLAGHAVAPGTQTSRAAQARALAAGLPVAVRTTSFASPAS